MLPTPPAAVAVEMPLQPLIAPAQTHGLEIELVVLTNRMIERLVDKRASLSNDERRLLERTAKARVAEILKRTAVDVAETINGVVKRAP